VTANGTETVIAIIESDPTMTTTTESQVTGTLVIETLAICAINETLSTANERETIGTLETEI
jgi:hypothetical protein